MAANCAAIENAGKWRGCLPGCTTSADSSLDGNTTSRTSSASSTLPAFTCCSDIYETSSRSAILCRGLFNKRVCRSIVLHISDLPDWLPDRWKAAQNVRPTGFAQEREFARYLSRLPQKGQ
jgi:hypothetical protein